MILDFYISNAIFEACRNLDYVDQELIYLLCKAIYSSFPFMRYLTDSTLIK